MKMTQSRLKMEKQNMTQIKSQSPLKELQISLIAPLEISQKTNITTSKLSKQFKNICSFFIFVIFIVIQNQNIGFITTAKAQTLAYQFNANSQCLYQLDGVTFLNTIHQISSNNICKSCLPYCVTCFNQTDTSCADGNCQNGYFLTNNSNMFSCQSCPVLCKQCSNFTISSCIQCIDSYYFDEYLLQCNKCPFGALTCSGSVILQCLSGFYYDSQSSLCKTCPNNCISCSSSSNCDACLNGFYQSQSGVCSKCGVLSCEYCADNNTCYQCLSGFYLNINGTNNQCLMFTQCGKYCIQCYNTSNSTLVCSQCNDGYYIYGGSCYFGSSFLCVSGYEGPTFAKCQSCSLIAQKSQYSSSTSSTYCLPIMSQSQQTKIQFYNFPQFELCSNPYFKSSLPSSNVSINLIIQPLYEISLRMTIISTSKNWSSHYSSLIDLHNKKFTLISQIVKSGEYFCKADTNLSKTVFKVQQKYFLSSISSNIKLQINTSSSYSLSVMQLYLQKFLCLSQNCLACYSTYYCSVCQNSYLLEEYNCVSQCSDGYYTNSGLGKCQIQCSVGYYYPNNNQMICQPCQTECISCIGVNICLSCINGYFLDQNQKNLNILTLNTAKVGVCTLNCSKNTTFQDKSLNFCSFCNNPCKTCQNIGSNCTSCLVGYLLFNNQTYLGKCVAQCPNGYYSSFSTIPQCSICSINCLTCQILSNYCTECKTGYFLSNGICLTSCPNKYYKNQFTNRCQSCQSNCQTCQKFPNNCNQCSKGYLLKLTENQLYLLINNSSNNSQTNLNFQSIQLVNMFNKYHNITSKISNFSFGICVNQCPLLYFYHNQTSSKCLKCPQNCQICEQSSQILEIKCKKCILLSNVANQTFLYAGNCVKLCPSLNSSQNLHFMDLKTLSCKTCKKPCLTCITDYEGTNCISCINQYYLLSNKTIQGKCVLRCPIGYYKSQQFSTCSQCPQQCTQCQTQTRCNVCSSGYVFVSLNYTCKYLANNNTLDVCESNFYLSQVLMECLRCNGNCKQCFSQSYFCIQCWDNQFLMVYQGICLDVCSEGYFGITGIIQINFTANGKNSIYSNLSYCKTCPQQCSTCLSLQICSNCKSGYFFYNNSQCLKSCPDSFYPNSIQDVNLCQKCPITCTKCVNPSLCSQCNSGMILIYNLCYSACQTGYFLVKNNSIYNSSIQQIKCSACPNSCETCQSYENCQTCKSGYFLSSSILPTLFQCVLECKQGFFKNHLTNQCQKCRYPCLTCKNQILCSSCQSTLQGNYLIYLNQACYQTCPDGYYFYEQPTNNSNINQSIFTCKLCEQSCLLCTSLTQCLKCSSPYFLSVVNNNGNQKSLCVTNCPLQYYSDNIKNQCVKCSPPCVNCYNSIACISCVQNYLLKGTICLPVCPVGSYISENSTNTCQSCPENCLSCQSQNICTVCYSNSYLFSEIQNQSKSIKCIKQCPNSTYLNLDSYSCQTCSVFCKQCINDPFTCTSCHSPLLLQTQRRICVQNCSDFLYQFNGFCMQCPKWCSNCANDSYCIKCVTGYLFNGRCETICPDGTYKNNQNFACQDCMTGCLKCKSLSVCLSCSSDQNYTLYSVKCILKPCPQGLFYYVQANQCVTRCDLNFILNSVNANKVKLLTDLINMQCHNPSASCPQGLIQSTDSLYCLERCPSNQLVLLKVEQNYNNNKNISQIVKPVCAPLQYSYITNQLNNILPDFKLNAIIGSNFDQSQKLLSNNNKILLLLLFNYQPLKNLLFNINNTQAVYHNSEQIKSFIQNQLLISLLTKSQSSNNYNFHKLVGSGKKASLSLSKAGNLVPWRIVQIRSNAVWIQIDISSQMMSLIKELKSSLNNNMSSNSISNKSNLNSKNEMLELSLQFAHPYQSFLSKDKVSNILLPPQTYQQNSFVNFNQLSILRQTNVSSNAGKVLFFLFISFSCIIFLLYLFSHLLLSSSLKKQLDESNQDHSHHLNQKQKQKILKNSNVSLFRYMSIFVNCLQYQQLFYLFCFLSTTFLPVGIEQLFKNYSILHMRLFLTEQKMQVIDFNSNRKLIQSPFQYYKYCGDISFFNNILDAMIIIAVIILSLVFAKIFSIIISWFNNNQNKNNGKVSINSIKKIILKINLKKRKIIQTIMFISMSYLALFSMINVFYKPIFILQSKQPFQVFQLIICYFLMILIMISPVYVFYFQYHNKNQYQNGTNPKKKQLGVSIPLYVYIRKILFVFFLTYYYQNGVYSLCIGMMSTAMIFVIIFWYEPYKNNWRNISAYINQGLLFIVFSLMLILVLNPEYSPFLQIILIIIITLLILSTLAYPSYCIFNMFYNSFHPEWNEDQQFDQIDGIKQGQQSDNFDQNSDLPQQKQFKQKHDLVTIQPSHISKLPKSIFQRPPLCTNNAGLSEADESQLQDRKKKPVVKNIQNYNIVRLAQKQQKKVKEFKNYVISDDDQNDSQSEEVNNKFQQKNNKNNTSKDPSQYKEPKYQF